MFKAEFTDMVQSRLVCVMSWITSSTITLMMEIVLQWSGTLDFMALWMTQLSMTWFM